MSGERSPASGPPRENPYVGLLPFGAGDVPWFFGRDLERQIIGANLRSSRLTLLYGASGVGKSSLLQAAVVPDLRAVVAHDRTLFEDDDPASVVAVRFAVSMFGSWRDAPLHGLMSAVAASVHEATGAPVAPWEPGTSLCDTFAAWLGPVTTLLVVLDQVEELFLYHPHDDGPGTFAGEFAEVVSDPGLRVNFLLSLREDGLAKLDRFEGRVPRLFQNYLRIDHLDLASARRAIEGPCEEYNRRLPDGGARAEIDAELIDAVLAEVRARDDVADGPRAPEQEHPGAAPRSGRVETPLLQLVMQRLWDAAASDAAPPHLRLATLTEQLGGTERIVYRHLDTALAALSQERRDLAVDVLRPLVSPGGTKIAWRADDLAYWAKRPTDEIAPILAELSSGERRILRTVAPPPTQPDQPPLYEIFHDILAEPILEWCAAREAERAREQLARDLEARERERREANERRRRERRNRAVRGVAIALAALAIGLIVAVLAALDRNELAQSRALAASATSQLPIDPELGLLLALQAVRTRDASEAEQALRRAVVASRVRARLGPGDPRPCRACAGLATKPRGGDGAVAAPLAIAPDGRTVAAFVGGRLRLWRPQTGATPTPGADVGPSGGVAFTPDASRLLVVGETATALMAPDGTRAVVLRDADTTGNSGATSPDGRRVITTGEGGAAIWDARTGARLARLTDSGYAHAAFESADRVMLHDGFYVVGWLWRTEDRGEAIAISKAGGQTPLFATAGGFVVHGPGDGPVRVVDLGGDTLRLTKGTPGDPVTAVAISPDRSRVATVRDSVVTLQKLRLPVLTGAPTRVGRLVHTDGVNAVTFSADSGLVGTASTDGTARVWESATGALVADLRGHGAGVESIAFSSRGRYVATVGEDLTVRLWDLGQERTQREERGVAAVAVSGSGSRIAIAQEDGELEIGDVSRLGAPRLDLAQAKRSPVRGPPTGAPAPSRPSPVVAPRDLHPTSLAFAALAPRLIVGYGARGARAGRLRLLDADDGRVRVDADVAGAVSHVAIDAKARVAAVVRAVGDGNDTRAELWSLAAPRPRQPLWRVPVPDEERPTDVALSRDGRLLLVTTVYGSALVFDAVSRKPLRTLDDGTVARPGPEAFYRGAFSPDGKTVAVAGSRDVRLWDAASGKERRVRLSGHTSVLRSVDYSADGKRIVTASADGTVRVWNAASGTALAVVSRHAGRVNDAAFLRAGWIVSGGEDRTVRAYPCESCAPAGALRDIAARQVTRDILKRELERFGG